MEENLLMEQTLTMTLTDKEGNVTAKIDMPYAQLANFRKTSGAPLSMLLDNMFNDVTSIALYGPNGKSELNNLPPRKPGESQRN